MKNFDQLPTAMTRDQFLDLHDAVIKWLRNRLRGYLLYQNQATQLEMDVANELELRTCPGTDALSPKPNCKRRRK